MYTYMNTCIWREQERGRESERERERERERKRKRESRCKFLFKNDAEFMFFAAARSTPFD